MKALIIAQNENTTHSCVEYLTSVGAETICYRWALKAMDNIEEVSPHLLLIDTDDFPRLWKTTVQFISADSRFDSLIVVLLSKKGLEESESDKAKHLNVRLVLKNELTESDKKSLYNLLTSEELIPERVSQSLVFRHPSSYETIGGSIIGMFGSMIIFKPKTPMLTHDIKAGTIIKSSTLKISHAIVEPVLKVLQNAGGELQLQILS